MKQNDQGIERSCLGWNSDNHLDLVLVQKEEVDRRSSHSVAFCVDKHSIVFDNARSALVTAMDIWMGDRCYRAYVGCFHRLPAHHKYFLLGENLRAIRSE